MKLNDFLASRTTEDLQTLHYRRLLTEAGLAASIEALAAAFVLDSVERRIVHTDQSAGRGAARRGPLGRGLGDAADTLILSWNLFARSRLPQFLDILADIKITIALVRIRQRELSNVLSSHTSQFDGVGRRIDLEAVAAMLVSASESKAGENPHLLLSRQVAYAAGVQDESAIGAILSWLATIVGEAVEIGIGHIRLALDSAQYSILYERSTLLYE